MKELKYKNALNVNIIINHTQVKKIAWATRKPILQVGTPYLCFYFLNTDGAILVRNSVAV